MKFKEVHEKTENELGLLEAKLRKELSELRMQANLGQLAETGRIGNVRRDIARVLTSRRLKLQPGGKSKS